MKISSSKYQNIVKKISQSILDHNFSSGRQTIHCLSHVTLWTAIHFWCDLSWHNFELKFDLIMQDMTTFQQQQNHINI